MDVCVCVAEVLRTSTTQLVFSSVTVTPCAPMKSVTFGHRLQRYVSAAAVFTGGRRPLVKYVG